MVKTQSGVKIEMTEGEARTLIADGEWIGRLALPFVTGRCLSAAEVASLYDRGSKLLGVA